MKIAVTGAAGFLGDLLAQALASRGHDVVGIDLPRPDSQMTDAVGFQAQIKNINKAVDLSDPSACVGILHGCDQVIHLAADGRPGADFVDSLLPNNVVSHYNILREAQRSGVKRVIYASSNHAQCFGFAETNATKAEFGGTLNPDILHKVTLNRGFNPSSLYGVCKVMGEEMGKFFACQERSFEFVALRIGWCVYEDPTIPYPEGSPLRDYLMSIWLSKRDCLGFFLSAVNHRDLKDFTVAYAVSNNDSCIYNLAESVVSLGYQPVDNSGRFLTSRL